MSDDLISRKAVIETVDRHTGEDGTLDEDISVILEEVKTAFYKEKVIDEIKNQLKLAETCAFESAILSVVMYYVWQAIGYERAIKIVEKGGIE